MWCGAHATKAAKPTPFDSMQITKFCVITWRGKCKQWNFEFSFFLSFSCELGSFSMWKFLNLLYWNSILRRRYPCVIFESFCLLTIEIDLMGELIEIHISFLLFFFLFFIFLINDSNLSSIEYVLNTFFFSLYSVHNIARLWKYSQ